MPAEDKHLEILLQDISVLQNAVKTSVKMCIWILCDDQFENEITHLFREEALINYLSLLKISM